MSESDGRQLSPEQFARVRDLFNRALALPPRERRGLIDEACGEDAALRRAAEELLAAADVRSTPFGPEGGSLVQRVLDADGAPAEAVPDRIGPYQIVRLIGRGGMGQVFLATQREPEREVALKILGGVPGSQSALLQSRFSREIRVLGRLEHPGIARIYEAGTASTPTGEVSYFAMEYIRGPRLTEYADRNNLSTSARLELVAQIADAVQHAHTRGVIHRDLKPSNILVDERADPPASGGPVPADRDARSAAQPKILDFGVARLLEPDSPHTALTEQGLLLGTIAYMSPEQLSGDAAATDMRADVYALGVILYELLSGRLPYDVLTKSIAEAARIIRDDEPAPLRGRGLALRFDRDLATIVQKAMNKDKDLRYATAAALSDDLRRFIRNEPILARAPTAAYQLSKFARRNRGLVIASAAAALAVTAGLVISTVLFVREQRARELAAKEAGLSTAVRSYMINGLLMAAAPGRMGYEVKMMDVLTHAADGLHERFAEHPEVEAEVRLDLGKTLNKLGKYKEGFDQTSLALPLLEKTVGRDDPRSIAASLQLADAALRMQDGARSLEIGDEALARAERLLPAGHPVLVGALNEAGAARSFLGHHDEAISMLRRGLDQAERAAVREEETVISMLTWLQASLGEKGDIAGALRVSRELAERSQRVFGPDHEATLVAHSNLVNLLSKNGDLEEAASIAVALPDDAERIFPPGHPARAFATVSAADTLRQAKRFEEAERFALRGYDAAVASFDDLNWITEAAMRTLRLLYTEWPGHGEQLTKWAVQSARVRLMVAGVDEVPTTLDTIKKISSQCELAGVNLGADGLTGLIWQERDQLAPPKHPRRSIFLGNLAIASDALGNRTIVQSAIDAATASLPDAQDRPAAEALIAAARGR